uniref:Reticulon-like protein n=1 Tax=Anthurium amnicola TaxID=1678845 RepID=A0A1D1ZFK5_9ARAE
MSGNDLVGHSSSSRTKLFGRQRPLHALVGGGRVADVVLWRDKRVSGGILVGVTAAWLLFEVAEYNLLTLLSHVSIAGMLVAFIWTNGAALFGRAPPAIPEEMVSRGVFTEAAVALHDELSQFLSFLHRIARGEDLKLFLLTVAALWVISVIGGCCSTLNLLYIGFLCILTLPFLYEKYEDEVDQLATERSRDLQKLYRRLDTELLSRIPRGPGAPHKEKKG